MVAHGMYPTNFGNYPRYPNQFPTELEEIVPETQQLIPTPELNPTIDSNPTPKSNPTPESNPKGKGKNQFKNRKEKQSWTRVEAEALMRRILTFRRTRLSVTIKLMDSVASNLVINRVGFTTAHLGDKL